MRQNIAALETVFVDVPETALEAFESALLSACSTVGFFLDEATRIWRLEGVKPVGANEAELVGGLALAELMTGVTVKLQRRATAAEGWLARTYDSFPEQQVGKRFAVRGTHLRGPGTPGRITLTLDAGVAFGSGEHGSTRGCLRALELVAHRQPRKILDLGTGSGILAMAAAKLLHRPVLATDIEPWSVRVTARNARANGLGANGLGARVTARLADGWRHPVVRAGAPYDLVFANILARPLCQMARHLAARLSPGGTAILAGLLNSQAKLVLAAHRRRGMRLEIELYEGNWTTLVLRR